MSLCDILLRPGVHIIISDGGRGREIDEAVSATEKTTAPRPFPLIDNCDKNVADEK